MTESKLKTWIFLGTPYSSPSPGENIHETLKLSNVLMDLGCFVICPTIICHYQDLLCKRSYDYWLNYTMEGIYRCDAYFYRNGKSSGVEKEIQLTKSLDKPVFNDILELIKWLKTRQ